MLYSHQSTTFRMPAQEATATETTTLLTARQISLLLQIVRLVSQGSTWEVRRYLARGGDPNARVYQARQDGSFYVGSEEYIGPETVVGMSLLGTCTF